MADKLPPEFYDRVDQFVALANRLVPTHGVARVSAVIMFAAARFNTHCARELDPEVDSNVEGAGAYFADQYSKMFRDKFDRLKTNPAPH